MCRNATRILRDLFKKHDHLWFGETSGWNLGMTWRNWQYTTSGAKASRSHSSDLSSLSNNLQRGEGYPYRVTQSFIWLFFLWFPHNKTYFNRQWQRPDPQLFSLQHPSLAHTPLSQTPSPAKYQHLFNLPSQGEGHQSFHSCYKNWQPPVESHLIKYQF